MIQVKTQVVLIENEDKKEHKVIKTVRFLGLLIFKKESPLGMLKGAYCTAYPKDRNLVTII